MLHHFPPCAASTSGRLTLSVGEVATKVSFVFYSDAQDALVKALDE